MPWTAAYELLSEPRVRCSFANCRDVSQEAIRSFYAEVAHAVNSVDPRTPMIIGPAPFYHVDGLPALMPVTPAPTPTPNPSPCPNPNPNPNPNPKAPTLALLLA